MNGAQPMTEAASARVLRQLFWKLFFRGRSGAQAEKRRKIGTWAILLAYGLLGLFMCVSAYWLKLAAFSAILHSVCLAMVLLNMASSASTFLFNQEEAEILLHRPVTSGALLRSKVMVLTSVALIMSLAFSLPGLYTGSHARGSNWLFVPAHLCSMALLTIFAVSLLVLVYNLCLRFFGRERLDNMMTTAQTLFTLVFILGSQLMPRVLNRADMLDRTLMNQWWHWIVPTSWFAAIDVLFVSEGGPFSLWGLALLAVVATLGTAWLALHKLAGSYGEGLIALNEHTSAYSAKPRRRWLAALSLRAPLKWWLRDPAERASFLLCAAYIFRDREMKMRLYPGLAPMCVYTLMMMFMTPAGHTGMAPLVMTSMSGAYFCFVPMLAMDFLRTSEHWRAADIFRIVPLAHWSPLYYGACKAVLLLFAAPMMALVAAFACWRWQGVGALLPLLPSLLLLPVWTVMSGLLTMWLPLSHPFDQQRQTFSGCLKMAVVLMISMFMAGISAWAYVQEWFGWLISVEVILIAVVYGLLRRVIRRKPWVEG